MCDHSFLKTHTICRYFRTVRLVLLFLLCWPTYLDSMQTLERLMLKMRHYSGFSLVELLVTIAVLAIVVSLAAPTLRETILNNRLTTQINEVSGLVSMARSEASKLRSSVVTLCASEDSTSCSGNATWETGWIMFSDQDADRIFDAGDDQIIKVGAALSGGNILRILGFTSNGGNFIQFSGGGQPLPSTTNNGSGTFVLCDERGDREALGVVVNVSGQVRLARDTDADGVVESHILDTSKTPPQPQEVACP